MTKTCGHCSAFSELPKSDPAKEMQPPWGRCKFHAGKSNVRSPYARCAFKPTRYKGAE